MGGIEEGPRLTLAQNEIERHESEVARAEVVLSTMSMISNSFDLENGVATHKNERTETDRRRERARVDRVDG